MPLLSFSLSPSSGVVSYCHGVRKRAKEGEIRVQSEYGGTVERYEVTEAVKAEAMRILSALEVQRTLFFSFSTLSPCVSPPFPSPYIPVHVL